MHLRNFWLFKVTKPAWVWKRDDCHFSRYTLMRPSLWEKNLSVAFGIDRSKRCFKNFNTFLESFCNWMTWIWYPCKSSFFIKINIKAICHTDVLLWSAREIASIALSAERERHTENVWHIALRRFSYLLSDNNLLCFEPKNKLVGRK